MRSNKLGLGLGIAAVLVLICSAAALFIFAGQDKSQRPTTPVSSPMTVRDGGFELTVDKVQCGVDRVGNDTLNKAPRGQYCLVTLAVKNVTDQPQLFTDSLQRASTATGTEVRSDPVAGVYANGENQALIKGIRPNDQVSGIVVFDIPKDTKLTKVELHGAVSGPGVVITVG